jgi:hypothetical protein
MQKGAGNNKSFVEKHFTANKQSEEAKNLKCVTYNRFI